MKLLEGKTALITGASRGIGKAIAIRFAQEGADIAFTDLVRNEVMEATEKELSALGVKAKGYASNAADFADTARVVAEIEKDFGRVDALVNNAGITKDTPLKRMTEEQWDAVINVNLKSVFNFTKAIQPVMWRQASGSVINMSSVVGVSGNASQCNYSASKAGIIGFTKSAGSESGPVSGSVVLDAVIMPIVPRPRVPGRAGDPEDENGDRGGPVWKRRNRPGRGETTRSEERRVGKECRSRWSPYH